MRQTVLAVLCLVLLSLAMGQQTGKSAADEVIAITKAQWAAEVQKNAGEAMKNLADEYTEFNQNYSPRVEGKAVAARLARKPRRPAVAASWLPRWRTRRYKSRGTSPTET